MKTVVAAAIKIGDLILSVPRPGRHHDVIRLAVEAGLPTPITGEQGFVDNDGRFLDRKQAMVVAMRAEQPIIREDAHTFVGGSLFSEDLW